MAFPKKQNPSTYLNKKVPTGDQGKKYIEELKNVKKDLEELGNITEQIKEAKAIPIDKMQQINLILDKLKKDTQKLNHDFPGIGFRVEEK